MSTFVEELADYLVGQSTFTAKGSDIFISFFPDTSADPACVLRDTGGPTPPINQPIFETTVQCMVRGKCYETARARMASIITEFHGLPDTALTSNHIMYAELMSGAADIGMDKNNRHLITSNFHFRTRPITISEDNTNQPARGGEPNLA